jgi:hypothetical protein
MPRSNEYTPARRYIMQAIMWAILGGTVALAAMVTKKQKQLNHLDLASQSTTSGNISVRMPTKWRMRSISADEDRRVFALAAESNTGEQGREVRVLTEQLDTPMSPLQYLLTNFGVTIPGRLQQAQGGMPMLGVVDIAGFPGVMITEHRIPEMLIDDEDARYGKEVYACIVLPTLQTITVQLTGGDAGDLSDEQLVQQIASAITIKPKPRLEDHSGITLADGITLTPPKDFLPVASHDELRVDRRLWLSNKQASELAEQRERTWTAIDVVGCIFSPPADPNDAQQRERAIDEAQTLLLVRDPLRWRRSQVTLQGEVYCIDPPAEQLDFPLRAYLLPDRESGRALLAVFHGGYDSEQMFDAMWKELAASVKFLPASSVAQLEDAGTAEASRLRKEDWNKLLTDRDMQWWLWTDRSERPHIGWANVDLKPKELAATTELRMRCAGGRILRVTEQWDRKGGTLQSETTRTLLSPDGNDDIDSVRQTMTLRGDALNVSAQSRTASLAQYRMSVPSQYVPGAVLTLLIGKLPPGPMLLVTDSFPGCQAIAAPRPIGVIIRPIEHSNRTADDGKTLRCVSVQVNGSGSVSHWHIDDDGSVVGIELPGAVQCNPTTEREIGYNFEKDGHMAPKKN